MAEVVASNLPSTRKESELRDLFEEHGKVKSIFLPSYLPSFAIIKMSTEGEADKAVQNLDFYSYRGNTIRVVKSRPNPPGNSSTPIRRTAKSLEEGIELVISNLPSSRDRKDIKQILKHYGEVENIKFPNDAEDQAIVSMSERKDGRAAMESLDGVIYDGNKIRISEQGK